MATTPATVKQLKFLEQLTGKDYSDEELTASEASKKIEKALANKGKEVADANLPPQGRNKLLPEHEKIIEDAVSETKGKPKRNGDQTQRSISMSYAVTLVGQGIVAPDKLLSYAEVINRWIVGDITVKDPSVFDEMVAKHFIQKED